MTAVIAGTLPLAGGWWLPSFASVAVCLLLMVPWRWSRPGVAALTARQLDAARRELAQDALGTALASIAARGQRSADLADRRSAGAVPHHRAQLHLERHHQGRRPEPDRRHPHSP